MAGDFKRRHFRGEIILWAVRWYCRYGVSCRDLEEMLEERGVAVDHTTIYRWVQAYAPEIEKRLRWHCRPSGLSRSWHVDETYIKVKGKWAYLYRAVDSRGNTIDFHLSQTRNAKAAKRFLGKALRGCKSWDKPDVINTDKAGCYSQAIRELKKEGKCPVETDHRQVKYLNNVVEADHGKLKRLIKPTTGFKSMKSLYDDQRLRGHARPQEDTGQGLSATARDQGRSPSCRTSLRDPGPEMMSGLMSLHGAELEQIAIQQGS